MTDAIASFFRSLNSQLLYREGLVNVLLKAPYLVSVLFFNAWIKKPRRHRLTVIRNYDEDLKIEVDISKTMGASLFWTGFHEFNELRFLNRYLKDDAVFIDVGANQGEFTLFAAKRVRKGAVFAFEPMSMFFDKLRSNVGLNGFDNVKCFRLGLSDHAAEAPIYLNATNPLNHEGLGSLYPVETNDGSTEVISLVTLDSVVEAQGIKRIDFIKIDVEGAEWAALRGAEQVLRKDKPTLMVELNRETAAKAGYKVEDMVSWLQALGYVAHEVVKGKLQPLKARSFCNAIFLAGK